MINLELDDLAFSLSLFLALQFSNTFNVLFVYELNARHQAWGSSIDKYRQAYISKLREWSSFTRKRVRRKLSVLLHNVFIQKLNWVLVPETSTAYRVVVQYVSDQAPLFAIKSVIPVYKSELSVSQILGALVIHLIVISQIKRLFFVVYIFQPSLILFHLVLHQLRILFECLKPIYFCIIILLCHLLILELSWTIERYVFILTVLLNFTLIYRFIQILNYVLVVKLSIFDGVTFGCQFVSLFKFF